MDVHKATKRHFVTYIDREPYENENGSKIGYKKEWLVEASIRTNKNVDFKNHPTSDGYYAVYHTGKGLSDFWEVAREIREREWKVD